MCCAPDSGCQPKSCETWASYGQPLAENDPSLDSSRSDWDTRYTQLNTEQQRRWRLLAVFPASFDHAATDAIWALAGIVASDALGDLVGRGLLSFDPDSQRYRLSGVARVFAGARLSAAERAEAGRRHAAHYRDMLAAAKGLYKQDSESVARGLALFELEASNILAGQA